MEITAESPREGGQRERADTCRLTLDTTTFAALALDSNQQTDTDGDRETNRSLVENRTLLVPGCDWFPQASKEYHHGSNLAVRGWSPDLEALDQV